MDAIPTLPKDKYVNRCRTVGKDLKLDTKDKFDEEKEKRIQLYAERWAKGYECLSGKPLWGGNLEEWHRWRKQYDLKTKEQKNRLSEGNSCYRD